MNIIALLTWNWNQAASSSLPSWLRMVDAAAEDGLDFLVLDAGWYGPEFDVNSNPVSGNMAADVQSLITYAKSRGVGIWLYLNDIGGITYPLATTMLSVPGAKTVRGFSFFGDSFVYVLFEDGTDLYWARSRVLEYLNAVQGLRLTQAPT